jgi:hypothetical protein
VAKFLRKNYSRGYNRTGQCATASLVNSGNVCETRGAQSLFVTKSASPVHPRKSLVNLRE